MLFSSSSDEDDSFKTRRCAAERLDDVEEFRELHPDEDPKCNERRLRLTKNNK